MDPVRPNSSRTEFTGFMVSFVDQCFLESSSGNRCHRHNFYEACMILEGKGIYLHEEGSYPLEAGDLFIAEPGADHEIIADATIPLSVCFTQFMLNRSVNPGGLHPVLEAFLEGHVLHQPGMAHLLSQCLALMDLQRQSEEGFLRRVHHELLQQLVLQMLWSLSSREASSKVVRPPRSVRVALDYIENSQCYMPSIPVLAKEAGVSERTLRRKFQEVFGCAVTEQIRRMRMQKAAHLLEMPELSLSDVAHQLGMEHAAQFSRAFKQVFGVSPSVYRREEERRSGFTHCLMKTTFISEADS